MCISMHEEVRVALHILAQRIGLDTVLLSCFAQLVRIDFTLCGVSEYAALLGAEVRPVLKL